MWLKRAYQNAQGAVSAHALEGEMPEHQNHWCYTVQEIPLLTNCRVISVPKCHVRKLVCGERMKE